MRRVVYEKTGGPDVLHLVEEPVPDPGPGQVRVRIHRSGINPTDWETRRGQRPGMPISPPQSPNQDGAGVVDAVGTGVQASLVGLPVWLWEAAHAGPYGTAGDYALVPERHAVTLPSSAGFDLGASLGVPFITAHHVIDYKNEDVVTEVHKIVPHGVQHIVEVATAQNAEIDGAIVSANASVACYADNGGDHTTLPIRPLMVANARWQFVLLYNVLPAAKERALDDVMAALLDRAINVAEDHGVPLQHFSLADTARAHDAVEHGAVGRVLVDVV